jgi:ribosomal protein L11 methylase PrmA
MSEKYRNPGSYRDAAGNVYEVNGKIYRTINPCAEKSYEAVRDFGVIEDAISMGFLVASWEVEPNNRLPDIPDSKYLIEHERIPFVSYPYEWSFSQLKAAALHHLNFQIFLLNRNVTLSDSSAYNIQFIDHRPIFIDLLSLKPYETGEYWIGHRQFCEQFLNPLLLSSTIGVTHNAWYRGSLEGISSIDLARCIPFHKKLTWGMWSQVTLQASLNKSALENPNRALRAVKSQKSLKKTAYLGLLMQLRNWISKCQPSDRLNSVWHKYSENNTYLENEYNNKKDYIVKFIKDINPKLLFDIGCNTGNYSSIALEAGADRVIGFDYDQRSIEVAYSRAVADDLAFLPLLMNASDPSPSQGWRQLERQGFKFRASADAIIALAFEHHLSIAKNIPLKQVLDWIIDIAPHGAIEFVPKSDPTIQTMLALRKDKFEEYTEDNFRNYIKTRAEISDINLISQTGRKLYIYKRKNN